MSNKTLWREYAIDKSQLGELTFFVDGGVQIGNRVYAPNAMIHDVSFANGHIARRRLDQPTRLEIIAPDGEHYYFRFGRILRTWYRCVPEKVANYSRFKQNVRNLGPLVGPVWWATGGNLATYGITLARLFLLSLPLLIAVALCAVIFRIGGH